MEIYKNCIIYGPYLRKDGRMHVIAIFPDGTRKTVSYPKYIMEKHLNRYLLPEESIDHVDCDFTNNRISNLRILDRKVHSSLDAKRYSPVECECQVCGVLFIVKGRKLHNIKTEQKRKKCKGPFCSKKCAGIASHNIKKFRSKSMVSSMTTNKSKVRYG